jgi:hypothetical protein
LGPAALVPNSISGGSLIMAAMSQGLMHHLVLNFIVNTASKIIVKLKLLS